jgi:nitric oxide synthase oxygenase domain/subunit
MGTMGLVTLQLTHSSNAVNLTHESRYNKCLEIAKVLNIPCSADHQLWKDRATVETAVAIIHSFREGERVLILQFDRPSDPLNNLSSFLQRELAWSTTTL